mmetsp:Transcript_16236/g.19874  ORF Transcript_16236/g.19874 Transcript_16236/m.19874 type:complete len:600 (+) Transcript_16236:617-2416(+)
MRLHLALQKMSEHSNIHQAHAWIATVDARDAVAEAIMNQCVDEAFNLKDKFLINTSRSMHQVEEKLTHGLEQALGSTRFLDHIVYPNAQAPSILYRPRRITPNRQALESLASRTNQFEIRFPLTAAILDDHSQLLQAGEDLILAVEWLLLLRKALIARDSAEPLSREQASDLSNRQALNFLPEAEEREYARLILSRYCTLFNKVLPQIINLYECERNPFLVRDPVTSRLAVDLSAGGDYSSRTEFSFETSVIFSLPAPPSMGEPVDAPSLCTIGIVRHLERLHNSAFGSEEIRPTSIPIGSCALERLRRIVIRSSTRSDVDIIVRTMIESNTAAPLQDADIKLEDVETNLRRRFLRGAEPIQLCLPSYAFLGSATSKGSLARLNAAIPQRRNLSPDIRQAIVENCGGRRNRLVPFIRFLEHAIRVLAAVGGNASSSLSEFAIQVLRIDEAQVEEWGLLRSATALCDVSNLLLLTEAMLSSSSIVTSGQEVMSRVRAAFCEPHLDQDSLTLLSAAAEHLHRPSKLLEALHDLLTGPLSDPDTNFDPQAPLKTFLEYQDIDLLQADDYQLYFPSNLYLRQALGVYNHLQDLCFGGGAVSSS